MIGRLQRQVSRRISRHHEPVRYLCKLELQSVTNVPSGFKHVKVLWQSDGGEDKASSGIFAVSSGILAVARRTYNTRTDAAELPSQYSAVWHLQVLPRSGTSWKPPLRCTPARRHQDSMIAR